jgi:hypothetical protein
MGSNIYTNLARAIACVGDGNDRRAATMALEFYIHSISF